MQRSLFYSFQIISCCFHIILYKKHFSVLLEFSTNFPNSLIHLSNKTISLKICIFIHSLDWIEERELFSAGSQPNAHHSEGWNKLPAKPRNSIRSPTWAVQLLEQLMLLPIVSNFRKLESENKAVH